MKTYELTEPELAALQAARSRVIEQKAALYEANQQLAAAEASINSVLIGIAAGRGVTAGNVEITPDGKSFNVS